MSSSNSSQTSRTNFMTRQALTYTALGSVIFKSAEIPAAG
jgi:hypothetical protein